MFNQHIINWEQYDLLSINFDPSGKGLYLKVSDLKIKITISSREVLHLVSCFSIDGYTPAFVVDINISKLDTIQAFDLMLKKGYQWMEPIDFPESIWHLHIEGGVVIDVFSEKEFLIQSEDL